MIRKHDGQSASGSRSGHRVVASWADGAQPFGWLRRATTCFAVGLAVLSAVREARAEPAGPSETVVRAGLLREYLEPKASQAGVERYGGAVMGTIFAGLGIAAAMSEFEDSSGRARWVALGTAGAASALSFSTYLLPAEYRLPVLSTTLLASTAGMFGTLYASDRSTPVTRWALGSIMTTIAAGTGLSLLDMMLQPGVSAQTLARHLERLERDPDSLSPEELRQMERDFALTLRPVPRWVHPTLLFTGSVIAGLPALDSRNSKDDRVMAMLLSSILMGPALIGIALHVGREEPYNAYLNALRNVHLAPLGPNGSAGLSLGWYF